MLSLFVLWCSLVVEVVSFFLTRYAVSAGIGVRGRAARVGFDLDGWRAVSLVRRIAFAAAGPFSSYLVAAACFAISLSLDGETRFDSESMRVTAAPGGPAAASGVEDGDRVVSVDGAPITDWPSLRGRIQAHAAGPVPLVVERAGRQIELHPVLGPDARIRIGPFAEHRSFGTGEAIVAGLQRPLSVLAVTFHTLFRHAEPVEVIGPVGIVRAVEATSRTSAPTATALAAAGTLISYFIGAPILVAIILFPRARRKRQNE
jgi:membrane-associated protease RseP (regulator of RpoE activity)